MTAKPQTGLRLPADVRRWLRLRAAERDTTLSRVVEDLARAEMARTAPMREAAAR